ncbi:hypothetical protein HYT23_03010 [Candidatus Pacearchaeota archaeon]|nr:hypothetical protein [Candidatus Pacearchaeota archaeon]
MNKLFPTYEVGSLPKLNARVNATNGKRISQKDLDEVKYLSEKFSVDANKALSIFDKNAKHKEVLTNENIEDLTDFNALLYLRLQEGLGLDFVYDGEARRREMYQHVAAKIEGFEKTPEMIRSRGPDSWRMAVCVDEPKLKQNSLDDLILNEFEFVKDNARENIKIPMDDPYMIAVMSDNRHYLEKLRDKHFNNPRKLRYEAKREFTLALARNIIRPQVKAVVDAGARWIQLDIPAATLDIEHIPIVVDGVNEVVREIDGVKFSLHMCYPRRVTLTDKNSYELLFPAILNLNKNVDHLSLELANADNYEKDLAVFAKYADQRKFEIGVGVVDITLEKQQRQEIETQEMVKDRILRAVETLNDEKLIYVAPDCGLRQLSLDRCMKLYEVIAEGAELARRG